MGATSVTSKGQVTIPKDVRRRLGIRRGTQVEFRMLGDRVELQVVRRPADVAQSGFGLLRSRRRSVPADFDAATLVKARAR